MLICMRHAADEAHKAWLYAFILPVPRTKSSKSEDLVRGTAGGPAIRIKKQLT